MRERSDGNSVRSEPRYPADSFNIHSARHLNLRGRAEFPYISYRPSQNRRLHIVEQDNVRRGGRDGGKPSYGVALYFDLFPTTAGGFNPQERVRNDRQVVVLDQNHIRKIHPMIAAASGPDGGLFEFPETRSRFARVEYAGAGSARGLDESRGERGDSRKPSGEIQSGSFGGKKRPKRPARFKKYFAARDLFSVGDKNFDTDAAGRRAKNTGGDTETADHSCLAGRHHGNGPGFRSAGRQKRASGVAERSVFRQGRGNYFIYSHTKRILSFFPPARRGVFRQGGRR
jgi:hypothetical protein